VTKYFSQGRDLNKPLLEVPESASPFRKLALRLLSGYLWLIFAFFSLAMLFYIVLATLFL